MTTAGGRAPRRKRLAVGSIVGVVVVAGVVALVVALGNGGDEPNPTAVPTVTQTDVQSAATTSTTLTVGEAREVLVPESGEAEVALTVEELQYVRISTQSPDEITPFFTVYDADGYQVTTEELDRYNESDWKQDVPLPAGEYTVVVAASGGSGSRIELAATSLVVPTPLETGETAMDIPADGAFIGVVDAPAGEYIIDVQAESDGDSTSGVRGETDGVLLIQTPDGATAANDDRDTAAPESDNSSDPYLEATATVEGELAVIVWEYDGEPLSGTVTIESRQ